MAAFPPSGVRAAVGHSLLPRAARLRMGSPRLRMRAPLGSMGLVRRRGVACCCANA